jgi:hypothetical protein
MESLARHWPSLSERYGALYASGAYLSREEQRHTLALVDTLRARYAIDDRRLRRLHPPPEPRQVELFPAA